MPASFDRAAARMDAAVDRLFAETIRIEPMTGGRVAASSADPDRQARECCAVVMLEPADAPTFVGRRGGTAAIGQTRIETTGPTVQLSPAIAAGLGYALAEGDHLVLISRPGMPRRRVIAPPKVDERGLVTLDISPVVD